MAGKISFDDRFGKPLHAGMSLVGGALAGLCMVASATTAAASDRLAAEPRVAIHVAARATPQGREAVGATEMAEPELRRAMQMALWPAEIARLAADYLDRFAQHAGADEAFVLLRSARRTAELLRRTDVELFRSAFARAPGDDGTQAKLLRQAALGDQSAALAMAQQVRLQEAGSRREVGWLQYASLLGSDEAAYALALHYRRDAQPLLAARYEARAIELGYEPPASLGHLRK